ncbi:hypothetical protein PV413_19605 [Streptomyces scabiei]|uniref:hypothetical protein n=1 Tax=Streptomyces scabiei TaxID=1930 RepID=UPI0029A92CF7|nr:hypothetical protein [Streptomyces scabiei]MDX2566082.1 hypothetical protein [Streptomyces scabiei]MDX3149638.1 hypothetical protein [Streptomyces scabiei]MDX3288122.1 hypothetical protein [Streptomyces scabiei]
MPETIYVRGEGGAIIAMDLPLPEPIQERFDRGQLVRVHSDGSPYYPAADKAPGPAAAPASEPGSALTEGLVPRPGARAGKTDWVLWAMAVHAIPEADAEAMTKNQLQDLPEQPAPLAPAGGDGRPREDAEKSEWIAYVVSKGLLSAEDAANYTKADLIDIVS